MTSENFNKLFEETVEKCRETLCSKAAEYATSDRLHNFKTAAVLKKELPTASLAGMMVKHTISVYDMVRGMEEGKLFSKELWDEKIGDSLNYLFLLRALLVDMDMFS